MNFPGMPGGAGSGNGGATAGMSDQEAAMVKAVSQSLHDIQIRDTANNLSIVDARSHGKLSFQDRYFGRNGICSWRSFRFVHVKRTPCPSGKFGVDTIFLIWINSLSDEL